MSHVVFSPTGNPTPSPFVTHSGQSLSLAGAPYRFVGFNSWRANVTSWNQPPNTSYLVNDGTTLADSLAAINTGGGRQNVIRAWFFQQFANHTSAYDWSTFDKTLSVCAAAGFKVIATLADQWDFEGPVYKDYTWYKAGGGYTSSTYAPTYEFVSYRQFVRDIVTRYANNTNILMWELLNEPQVTLADQTTCASTGNAAGANAVDILSAFVQDVGGLIKSIDANHLLSVGMGGSGACGTLTGDYKTIVALPQVDLCSFHDYEGAANAGAFETNNGLNTRIPQAAAVNKPIFIGECGIHSQAAPVSGDLNQRATYLDNKMSAQFAMQGMVGYLPWQFDLRGFISDDYVYGPNDPGLAKMDAYCY